MAICGLTHQLSWKRELPGKPMKNKGFTLVEIMMVLLITTLSAGAIYVMAQTSNQVWNRADVKVTAMEHARMAMNRVVEDLRHASKKDFVCEENDVLNLQDDELDFYLAPRSADDLVKYEVTNIVDGVGQLERDPTNGNPILIASNISVFDCTALASEIADIVIEAQVTTTQGGVMTQRLESHVWLQNP